MGNIETPHLREYGFRKYPKICLLVESGIRNPESGKFRNWALKRGIQFKESGTPLTVGICNQKFTAKESGIHAVESKIKACLGFPCLGIVFA